ncbi:hypothetical protein [uncultured Acetatifactor sp.]|jgi:hypothetical protein|uniref:hypothetical protein n=1 Tax=uncultured Acetatifactor sp. TaxID=1671927 RepID=UPI0026164CC9|nr:hypothetical protein [uncultured Acetatifactor sp.]
MIRRATSELKIIGINFFILSAAFTSALIVLSAIAGELIPFYPVSFEVLFPFFATIAVGEWGKTRADSNFDIIAAQSGSLFHWILLRYVITFGISSVFAVFCMVFSSALRYELPLWELLIIYFPPAFFLSSLCALFGIHHAGEHIATLSCGILWLIVLLTRSVLGIPGAEYIYLFIRYAEEQNPVWLWNKCIVTAMGFSLWGIIYALHRNIQGAYRMHI